MADERSASALPRAEPAGRARSAAGTLRRLADLFDTADPGRFLQLLGLLCLLVLVAIIGLTSLGIDRVYRNAMVERAESAAVSVGQAIFANERENLLVRDSGGNEALHLPAERRREFDAMMRNYAEPFRVLKIKIFSADKRVIYSTDPGLIGRRDAGNETLERVLRERRVDSTAKQTNQFTELGGTVDASRQVVETYLPIVSGERVLGAFEIYVDIGDEQRAIERAILEASLIAGLVAALSLLALYLALRRATMSLLAVRRQADASSDPLTGLLDRRALIHAAERQIARLHAAPAARTAGIGLVMLELDHLGRIDEAHGRAAAELAIRTVAGCLDRITRKRDLVGRYRGEGFLLVLPETTRDEASALAERLRGAIAAAPLTLPDGTRIGLGASFGVARLDLPETDFESAVGRADEALARARQAGRNRVRISD